MIKAIVSVILLAMGLTVLVLLSGYLDYRREMNECVEAGGVVIKTTQGLKCVPRGRIKYI